ncbi:MAG: hypothetical protein ACRDF7_07425 [Candidatus Limnocylindrales bacterium]
MAKDHLGSGQWPTIDARCYDEGGYLQDGQPILTSRTTLLRIVVFTFEDHSRHAIGIVCFVEAQCEVGKPIY